MMDILRINGKSALSEWGVTMGDGFIESLLQPSPMKDYITNKIRIVDGAEIVPIAPKIDDRDITLNFVIGGKSASERSRRQREFMNELMRGVITLELDTQEIQGVTYNLYYRSCSSYHLTLSRKDAVLSVKFYEPLPNR